MKKKMYAEMMSELKKEEEEEEAIYNHAEPREGDKENHFGDLRGGTRNNSGRQEQAESGADTGRAAATHKTGTASSAAGTERKT
jgi:hypothetical protein